MNSYRSLSTIDAIQYTGAPIDGVTCSGSNEDYREKGCDNSRRHLPHVHTLTVGGITVLQPGDWIFRVVGGPFGVASDAKFRASWQVIDDRSDLPELPDLPPVELPGQPDMKPDRPNRPDTAPPDVPGFKPPDLGGIKPPDLPLKPPGKKGA